MKLTLDLEPEEISFDNLAVVLFHSQAPNYTFVDDLNHLYSLSLSREDDMPLDTLSYPHYSYRDTLRQLSYHLLERPNSPSPDDHHSKFKIQISNFTFWQPLHKLLLIQGDNAQAMADRIAGEFTVLPPAPAADDLAATARYRLLEDFHASFTPVSLLDPAAPLPPNATAKSRRERNDIKQLLTSILQYFDLSQTDF